MISFKIFQVIRKFKNMLTFVKVFTEPVKVFIEHEKQLKSLQIYVFKEILISLQNWLAET